MHRFTWPAVVVAVTLALALLAGVGSAQANAPRVTRGEAQAIFQAPPGAEPDSIARISLFLDGRHYCSLDWHVISLGVIEGNAAGETRTNTEIRESLSQVDFVFNLDGALLDTMRTPIKRLLNPERLGLVEAFYVQEGQVMAPDDLSVGAHSLSVTVLQPGFEPAILSITFSIDAPGEGTCL